MSLHRLLSRQAKFIIFLTIFSALSLNSTSLLQAQIIQRPPQQPGGTPPAGIPQALWNDPEFQSQYKALDDLNKEITRLQAQASPGNPNARQRDEARKKLPDLIKQRNDMQQRMRRVIQEQHKSDAQNKADEIKRLTDQLKQLNEQYAAKQEELKAAQKAKDADAVRRILNEMTQLQNQGRAIQNTIRSKMNELSNLLRLFQQFGGDPKWQPSTSQSSSMNQSTSDTQLVSYTEESGMDCLSAAVKGCTEEDPCKCDFSCSGEMPPDIQETLNRMAEACAECKKLQGQPSGAAPSGSSSFTV